MNQRISGTGVSPAPARGMGVPPVMARGMGVSPMRPEGVSPSATLACAATLAFAAFLASGCSAAPSTIKTSAGPSNTARAADDLSAAFTVTKAQLTEGDQFCAAVTLTNTGRSPITIEPVNAAPFFVRMMRHSLAGWNEHRRYPEFAMPIGLPYTLSPGQSRTFSVDLTVTPDWPTAEPLRLQAVINGRPDLCPAVLVQVQPARQ